ncbi:hypothetical protein B0H14DRAFT_2566631 [Mycena olivaceomarginata]|nr:hypothetical protein B0H14DRAFT_2566631 [Mycena olivaceomarginata]
MLYRVRRQLFSKIYFTPYFTDDKGPALLPLPPEVERRIERLDFLSSDGIAPLVQQCHISPHTSYGYRENWSFSTDAPYILLDTLFERLPCFTGLQQLELFRIALSPVRVDILFRLPQLSRLHVSWCTVTPQEHVQLSPGLHLSDFELRHDTKLEHGEDYWIPLLHPDRLRLLTLSFNGHVAHNIPIFPNVRTLTAIIHDTLPSHPQNLTTMSKFPGVRTLKMSGRESGTGLVTVQCKAVFPHLGEYYDPCKALPLFLAASTLTHIQTKCARPQDFLTHILGIQGHKITSFNATFKAFSSIAFNEIVQLLPQLTELLLTITVLDTSRLFEREIYDLGELAKDEVVDGQYGDSVRSGFTVSTFFLELSSAPLMPSGLESLAIGWESYDDHLYDELMDVYRQQERVEIFDGREFT